ncbi:serine hydrolase domain-containing protein [Gloeothece verrucosa]|uniref:Beta-lactamase n=1 Tax=Gloeothece verrucosa (strain PCC 7822) TaxID=497965 RepID=E0UF04_GLOV7|nr:serine hydrolase domain-containing protein [Gloeothece verrucosa]ADN14256.1 beta-lactamase [Gloeothece verrucosa PCC 7822]
MKKVYSRRSFGRFLLVLSGLFAGGLLGLFKGKEQAIKPSVASPTRPSASLFSNAKLQEILEQEVTSDHVPGLVMYLSTPKGVWSGGAGLRSLETGQQVQPDDAFSIASTSKTFVAVIVLQLVGENKIKLDQPIAGYLPKDISDHLPYSSEITVRQLLNHTSGVAEYLSTKGFVNAAKNRDRFHPWTAHEAIQFILDRPPRDQPGKTFAYTDSNYILLQLIIEGITGATLAEVTRERILNFCGLKHTYTELWESPAANVATGYTVDGAGKLHSQVNVNDGNGLGDGALMSTAEDLSKFLHCLLVEKRLLSPSLLQEMLTFIRKDAGAVFGISEYTIMGVKGYGLGIEQFNTPYGEAVGHTGSAYGFVSAMLYLRSGDATAIVLANEEGIDPVEIAFDGLKSVFD